MHRKGGKAYTKGSFTETTKTGPAFLSFAELMYPGTCDSLQDGAFQYQHMSMSR